MWQIVLAIAVAAGLGALLARQFLAVRAAKKAAPGAFFAQARDLVDGAQIGEGATAGSFRMRGLYNGLPVDVQAVADTLNTRKLPSLWLLVTIPEPLPVRATFDLMMRASGPSTFSNFEQLPVAVKLPAGFPETAAVRTDNPGLLLPFGILLPHLEPFFGRGAKELLITPAGIRMVVQVAEAARARYGVFREASFGNIVLEPETLRGILERLIAVRKDIAAWTATQS